jgi:methionine-gamma-lyase
MKRIAIPVDENKGRESKVSSSFGGGRYYIVAETVYGAVASLETRAAPDTDCSKWNCKATDFLRSLRCDVVIAPRLGERARSVFQASGVEIVGTEAATAGEVLDAYLQEGPRRSALNEYCPHAGAGIFTTAAHAGGIDRATGAVMPPIYQTSTFAFENAAQGAARFAGEDPGFIYSRMGNPTVRALEDSVAKLENGYGALATATGMAAVATVFTAFLGQGLHVASTDSVYGPSRSILEKDLARFGVDASFVDTADPRKLEKAMRTTTRLVYIETPANPTIKLTDIAACAEIAHAHGALLVVDNTFMSPYLQQPFEMGADVVLHSMTKFLNGHSDVVAGMIVTRTPELYQQVYKSLIYFGGTMDPHQAYLVLRGVKTLPLRVERAQQNAMRLAEYLEQHEKVAWVRYPGLESHPQYELAQRQMRGPGALISFEVRGGIEAGQVLLDSVRVPVLAVSLGGVESLIQHPASMTHAGVAPDARLEAGITDGLVRLSVGCEDYEDLRDDLERALDAVPAAQPIRS